MCFGHFATNKDLPNNLLETMTWLIQLNLSFNSNFFCFSQMRLFHSGRWRLCVVSGSVVPWFSCLMQFSLSVREQTQSSSTSQIFQVIYTYSVNSDCEFRFTVSIQPRAHEVMCTQQVWIQWRLKHILRREFDVFWWRIITDCANSTGDFFFSH